MKSIGWLTVALTSSMEFNATLATLGGRSGTPPMDGAIK